MKHSYLTQTNIQHSLLIGTITYKEAHELTMTLEICAKSVAKKEPICHGTVIRHQVV